MVRENITYNLNLLNLLNIVLWSRILTIMVNVPWLLEKKKVYFALSFRVFSIYQLDIGWLCLIFLYPCWYLRGLSVAKSDILKRPTVSGYLCFSVKCIGFWFMYFKALYLVTTFRIIMYFGRQVLLSPCNVSLSLLLFLIESLLSNVNRPLLLFSLLMFAWHGFPSLSLLTFLCCYKFFL